MIRAPLGDVDYWNSRVRSDIDVILKNSELAGQPSENPIYEPQFIWNLAQRYLRVIFREYSKGSGFGDFRNHLLGALICWGKSNTLADEVCKTHNLKSCRDWEFSLVNLNHYNWCFWLVGLALALEIPDDQWQRLLALVGGEGEDILLDRIIATRQPDRKIGTDLLHPKPYSRLLEAINAPVEQQARLLLEFVENWYPELSRKGKDRLWWYDYGDPEKHPLEKGSYFGRWCVEAVAAVKAFGLDDSLCHGHENYPGDLLRPNGPTTHKPRAEAKKGWLLRLLGR
ncbi:TPA: PoNe immunity protein domain-containing protein [Pseudomonas aeruginosa]|uniref:PoNi-like cognate immunity protein n=1 Tax=Pseudomonas aeruginosa TaxID=287 RepID=UPI000FC43906|nr:PoNi-like cognate immunity protein [Pseudomonas aeruginosa]RUI12043.1 DUF1911 domain-containing protein [Pseudomonas aeruginosa]HBO4520297.1 DUF1911 domain-containing protein [Pseudomonas aeruginosa]HBO6310297.1 DUF1911 domain-containing protein [Pseudomonas aeruginosa]